MSIDLKQFTLKSDTPSRNSHQEWWTFRDKYGNTEVVLRNWRPGSKHIQGPAELVQFLHNKGLLDSPCTIDLEFLKQYQIDVQKAQTNSTYSRF